MIIFVVFITTRENLSNIPSLPCKSFVNPLTDIQITAEEVTQQLTSLQPRKSAGPDH